MKLVIPPQCKIGARTYKIVWWNEKMQYSSRATAQGSSRDEVIRLDNEWSVVANFVHLIHELRHQTSYLISADADDENTVRSESELFAQALLSLGIEPDFSLIKEEKTM